MNHILPVYLDNNATTRVDQRVVTAMLPWFEERIGNSDSLDHSFGWDASDGIENARSGIAELIGADATELSFSSGSTESIVTVLSGIEVPHQETLFVVACASEHHAVLETLRQLQER